MLKAIQADINTLQVGTIVNAVNNSSLGDGGTIHRTGSEKIIFCCFLSIDLALYQSLLKINGPEARVVLHASAPSVC